MRANPNCFLTYIQWKLVGFGINLLQTRWPLKRFSNLIRKYSTRQARLLTHQKTMAELQKTKDDRNNAFLMMKELLKEKEAFNLFMKHCGHEHCIECVSSMIEFTQFKEKIYEELKEQGRSEEVDTEIAATKDVFTLPDHCPKSDIVFSTKENFKQIAINLYQKYIEVGSDWEINIDYHSRKAYQELFVYEEWMNNKEYEDSLKMYGIFDKCLTEMTNLVRSAFSRFKQTDSFLILQKKSSAIRSMSIENRGKLPKDKTFKMAHLPSESK